MQNIDPIKQKLKSLTGPVPSPPPDQAMAIWSQIQKLERASLGSGRPAWWNLKWALGFSLALTALSFLIIPSPTLKVSNSEEEDYVVHVFGNAFEEIESSYEIVDASYEEFASLSQDL